MIVAPATRPLRIVTLAALLAVPALVVAAAPQDIVKTRQTGMKTMGGSMKAIGEQVKSGTPDGKIVTGAAHVLATAAKAQGKLFPAGTAPGAGIRTEALPAIWNDRKTFDADMAALVAASVRLETVAGTGDAAAIGAQMKAVGATCGACHKQFRAKD